MNTLKALSLAALVASSASFAQAETNLYGGISTILANYEETGTDLDLNLVQLQVGNRFNENFAAEARAGVGTGDDSEQVFGTEVKLEADSIISVFAKGIIPVGPVELYGLAGWTRLELTASASTVNVSTSDDDTDISYGLGMSFNPTESTSLFVEYMNMYDKDDVEINGITLGFNASF